MVLVLLFTINCTEPFEFEAEEFENILVIDASITDEIKTQEILLSRTFLSGEEEVQESGANVSVVDDTGVVYQFQELQAGIYVSSIDFGAVSGREYKLNVQTRDGVSYSSASVSLPPVAEIEQLEAVRTTNELGIDGVAILVNAISQGQEAGFYRYEYEETYRIVSLFKTFEQLVVVSEDPPMLELVVKDRDEFFCYDTLGSNVISITDTQSFSQNRVSDFQVRFIAKDDPIISSRYSILVKQFTQSREANAFYNTLQEFSTIESIFTQTQPGFIEGNIRPDNNPEEKVLGYFEATSVTSKRLFFSFNDIFTQDDPLRRPCGDERRVSRFDSELFTLITSGKWRFLSTDPLDESQTIYLLVKTNCVDCTLFGTNIKPDFWLD
ncbi:hypothetical protein MTsPCn9_16610 [Croceitalea sp. MTPC9]|nr:hypothetical protein MTsPCn6_09460 [Croceitalea sp. MTPC6]GMN16725.1 hypothetical protein MTsPCn9_16610 [Croceitalea sp. MTPC9]